MNATQVGIIGGADGPTSIFIATTINWPFVIGLVLGLLVVTGLILMVIKKRQK